MENSKFSILMANLFILGSFITPNILDGWACTFLSFIWLLVAVKCTFKEREQAIIIREYINRELAKNVRRRR